MSRSEYLHYCCACCIGPFARRDWEAKHRYFTASYPEKLANQGVHLFVSCCSWHCAPLLFLPHLFYTPLPARVDGFGMTLLAAPPSLPRARRRCQTPAWQGRKAESRGKWRRLKRGDDKIVSAKATKIVNKIRARLYLELIDTAIDKAVKKYAMGNPAAGVRVIGRTAAASS